MPSSSFPIRVFCDLSMIKTLWVQATAGGPSPSHAVYQRPASYPENCGNPGAHPLYGRVTIKIYGLFKWLHEDYGKISAHSFELCDQLNADLDDLLLDPQQVISKTHVPT